MTYKFTKIVLFFSLFIVNANFAENKIIYLISPPRSLSTAFLRMMEARNDFTIMNEPSLYAQNKNMHREWFSQDVPQNFETIKNMVLKESQTSHVFVKEMSVSVKHFLLQNKDLLKRKNIYFVFLLRNPHHSILSLCKKLLRSLSSLTHIMPYQHTYEVLQLITQNSFNTPLIIFSEDLYEDPPKTIRQFCNHVGIEYKENALNWNNLGDDFTGVNEWHEIKSKEITHHWHGDAIQSSCFTKPRSYATDINNGLPTFEEITNAKDRKICKKIYYANLSYYNKILKEFSYLHTT